MPHRTNMKKVKLKTRSLPIRLSQPEIEMIETAASLCGENRSEFVRNAAKEKANSLILRSEAA